MFAFLLESNLPFWTLLQNKGSLEVVKNPFIDSQISAKVFFYSRPIT